MVDVDAVNGYGSGRFSPNDDITRGQIAAVVVKAFVLKEGPVKTDFPDTSNSEFRGFIHVLASNGIVGGCADGRYGPSNPVTRAEFTVILSKAIEVSGRDVIIASTVPEENETSNHVLFNEEMLLLINNLRPSECVSESPMIDSLQQGADIRIDDFEAIGHIALNGRGHVRPNGDDFSTAFNYLDDRYAPSRLGENAALTSEYFADMHAVHNGQITLDKAMADTIFNQYRNSQGHYENTINPNYGGFATAVREVNVTYYNVQIFTLDSPADFN